MFEDFCSIEGNFQGEALGSTRIVVLLKDKASGVALLQSENPIREGDVQEHHIMKKGPHMNTEQPLLRVGI